MNYVEINRTLWNKRTEAHFGSEFYDVKGFLEGRNPLKSIELDLLGDVKGKRILHLQCHFGQDTLALARMGAIVTGVDLSDQAIERANELAAKMNVDARFICCDLFDLPSHLDETFDMVFTSYGTIGWLPDINKWGAIVSRYLKKGGMFVFAEFHPVVWMFDNDFTKVTYRYFKSDAIVETEENTYGDKNAVIQSESISWNHGIGEVVMSLIAAGLQIKSLQEYDYSPYDCFQNIVKVENDKYRIRDFGDKIPMVYSITATKL